MRGPRRAAAAALAVGLMGSQGPALGGEIACAPDLVTAVTEDGSGVTFRIEIADDDQERALGLMYRREMAADAGMLFVYEDEAQRFFWMRNTYLPLDIIFADATGRVVHVAANTVPFSERTIPSGKPALGVLEINAGLAEVHGIEPDTILVHPAFAAEAAPEFRCE